MWLRTSCDLAFDVIDPTPFILMLRPRSGVQQWVARESYTLTPKVPVIEFTDGFGNLCQRLIAPPGKFSIQTTSDVLIYDSPEITPQAPFDEVQTLPNEVLAYLLPSRYCESDRFIDLSRELVAGVKPGYEQVACIKNWIRRSVVYNPESENFQLSAVDINERREGVCRELAHLGIALCRGLCIPARMVVGYLEKLEPMDFHAWFEAYMGGRWWTFDAIEDTPRFGRVTVAYGRDAADVAIFNQFGPPLYPTTMKVTVKRLARSP